MDVGGRIAHISTADLAIKYLLRNQLRLFHRAGFEVFAISAPGPFEQELRAEPFSYECVPIARRIHPIADARAYARLRRLFAERRIDLVHTHTNKAGILGCWSARAADVPRIVCTVHGFYFHEHMQPAVRAAFAHVYRETFRFVDRVFMQSMEDVDTAVRHRIIPEDRLVHIGNGIDLGRFDPTRPELDAASARLRRSIGVPGHAVLVGMVSRINHEKGHRQLLAAVKMLALDRRRHVHLVIIGDGPARTEFERMAEASGVGPIVHFVGFQENVPEWLAAMDVYALPSYREGFPRTLCEAFAMGTPCVATRIRGCRELVTDGESGLLAEPRDTSSLLEALDLLVTDASLRRRLADNARGRALRDLDECRVVDRILAVYEDLGLRARPRNLSPGEGEEKSNSGTTPEMPEATATAVH